MVLEMREKYEESFRSKEKTKIKTLLSAHLLFWSDGILGTNRKDAKLSQRGIWGVRRLPLQSDLLYMGF